MEQQTPVLGKLITDGERRRDAVHIAIAPVTAGQDLLPGQSVGFLEGGDVEVVVGWVDKILGIVDPFLEKPVRKGERFWLFLYPNTITGLRHVWKHPAFANMVSSRLYQARKKEQT